jgi:hypothetical protein
MVRCVLPTLDIAITVAEHAESLWIALVNQTGAIRRNVLRQRHNLLRIHSPVVLKTVHIIVVQKNGEPISLSYF